MSISSKTVLFVTGAFVTHQGWDPWKVYFESKGYKTVAPAWPAKEGPPAVLRGQHPNSPIAKVRLSQVIDHYAKVAEGLPEKPIIVGHSLGGLTTQVLINRGLGVAGVCIHPVPPQGVFPYEFSFLKSGWKALGLFTSTNKSYLMSLSDWQYAFTNGMTLEEQKDSYEKNTIPESKLVARDGLTSAAKVDFRKDHVPLLIITGTKDHIMPAHLALRIYKKYKATDKAASITEFKEFEGNNHFVLGLPNWKTTADYVLDWIGKN